MLPGRSRMRVAPVHRRRQMRQHVERRRDEREVGERLREVPEQALLLRVVLLGEEADVVREADQPLEQHMRIVVPAEELVAVDEPERAGKKDAFANREPVDAVIARSISEDKAVTQEVALDRCDRAAHARVACGEEADERDQEQAGVELLRAVGLDEAAKRLVVPTLEHLRSDLVANLMPTIDWTIQSVLFDGADG